jgi:hypothetical protein
LRRGGVARNTGKRAQDQSRKAGGFKYIHD